MDKKQISKNSVSDSGSKLTKKRFSFSSKLIIFLALILCFVSIAFYLYIKTTAELKIQYNQGIKYLEALNSEQERCSNLLSQESGRFDDYEYCRQLLQVFPKDNYDEIDN